MTRQNTSQPRFRPRVDRFEDRLCPAVDVVQRDNFLFITGDAAADWVAVCDEGGQVVEVQTARGTETFTNICWVVGGLGEGNDTFEFHQAEGRPSELLDVRVDLAAGDDRFLYRSPPPERETPPPGTVPPPELPATYTLDVRGGIGNDVMIVGPEYVPGLDLFVRADLGDGHDTFDASYQLDPAAPAGPILPCVSVAVAAGAGDDHVNVAVGNPDILDPMRLEDVTVSVGGGAGSDTAIIIICNVAVPGVLSQAVDGGGGDDTVASKVDGVRAGTLVQQVNGGDGVDFVGYIIDGGRIGSLSQAVGLGGGDDAGIIIIGGNVAVIGPVVTRLDGGDGADNMAAQVGFNPQPDPPGGPRFGSAVLMSVSGGPGADFASVLIQDSEDFEAFEAFEGPLTLRVAMGGGDDLANVVIRDVSDVVGPLMVAVDGGAGADRLSLVGLGGPDTLPGVAPPQFLLDGGAGDDDMVATVQERGRAGVALSVHLVGGLGDDHLVGSHGDDRLEGGVGHDTLDGRGGADILLGGYGNDFLLGGEGDDELYGGDGADLLSGEEGDDLLHAGSGFGLFLDDNDPDVLIGGSGADRFTFVFPGDVILDFNPAEGDQDDF